MLFLDEIHRFNRAQQDAFLGAVEDGVIILIGATTENPFFEVNSPLLSRSLLFRLEPLSPENVEILRTRDDRRARPPGTSKPTTTRSSGSPTRPAATPVRRMNALEAGAELAARARLTTHHSRRRAGGSRAAGHPVRQSAGPALRRHLGVHQVDARLRSRRGAVLAVRDDRRRRGPEVHRPPDDRAGVGGHRPRRPESARRRRRCGARPTSTSDCPSRRSRSRRPLCTSRSRPSRTRSCARWSRRRQTSPTRSHECRRTSADSDKQSTRRKLAREGKGYKYPHNFPGATVEQDYRPAELEGKTYWDPEPDETFKK